MKKIFPIAYFIILFAILGSYLMYAIPDTSLRFSVAGAQTLSISDANMISVIANDTATASHFENNSVAISWGHGLDDASFEPIKEIAAPLPENGRGYYKLPKWEESFGYLIANKEAADDNQISAQLQEEKPRSIRIRLIGANHQTRKSIIIPEKAFTIDTAEPFAEPFPAQAQFTRQTVISSVAPSAFMMGKPNEVMFVDIIDGAPYLGDIVIEHINTQTPESTRTITASASGVTSIPITIQAQSDYRITAGNDVFYASYVISEKPFHATIKGRRLSENDKPVITVTPVGSPQKMYLDFFDGNAWIDHQIVLPNQLNHIVVSPDIAYYNNPRVIYVRLSASEFATPESSQIFPVFIPAAGKYTQQDEIGLLFQQFAQYPRKSTATAKQHIRAFYQDSADDVLFATAPVLQDAIRSKDARIVREIKEFLLARLAEDVRPEIKLFARTDEIDSANFDAAKAHHREVTNRILVIWFAIGVTGFAAVVIRNARRRRQCWLEAASTGIVENIPEQTPAYIVFILAFLIFGLMVSLFFMMQLI